VAVLQAENVMARKYFYPGVHRMEPYQTLQPEAGQGLPNTEILTRSVLALPTGTALGEVEIGLIGKILEMAILDRCEIKAALAAKMA
jgi:dTDP-4-amino-4,6-dideoxygalactose transaminase